MHTRLISPFEIFSTSKKLHLDFNLDFTRLSPLNYRNEIERIASDERLRYGLSLYAMYVSVMSDINNVHINNYFEALINQIKLNCDVESAIVLDDILHDDSLMLISQSATRNHIMESLVNATRQTINSPLEHSPLYPFVQHYFNKYYSLEKGMHYFSSKAIELCERVFTMRVNDYLNDAEYQPLTPEYLGQAIVFYNKVRMSDNVLGGNFTFYMINSAQFADSPELERVIRLSHMMLEAGFIAPQMMSLVTIHGSDDLFEKLCTQLDSPKLTEASLYVRGLDAISEGALRSRNVMDFLPSRIDQLLDKIHHLDFKKDNSPVECQFIEYQAGMETDNPWLAQEVETKCPVIDRIICRRLASDEQREMLFCNLNEIRKAENLQAAVRRYPQVREGLKFLTAESKRKLLSSDLEI